MHSTTKSLSMTYRSITHYLTACILLIACASSSWAAPSAVTIGEPEAWVIAPATTDLTLKASDDARDGVFYRLMDRQINAIDTGNRSKFTMIEYEFTSRRGVQDRSTLTIDFDPNYESLVVHQIGIIRNDVYIDKLPGTELEVLRTEQELDRLFYNGTQTLTAILKDVRVGDILRFSYSRKGENPVYEDLIEYSTYTQYYDPMASASFRLMASESKPLYIRKRNTANDIFINKSVENGVQQISWSKNNLTPLQWEDDEPKWTRYRPAFVVSSAASWQAIVDWSLPKYAIPESSLAELNTAAEKIKRRYSSKHARAGAALQWVQKEIRYFGVELGENSHNPSPPEDTLARRFGDCKDKTVLLIELLGKLDIEASPALVNSEGALNRDKDIFRLHAFDHVITHVEIDGRSHWIDPTRQNQSGALGEFYEPNYGKALVVRSGQTDLVTMFTKNNSDFKINVIKQYDIDDSKQGEAHLKLTSKRKGLSAETYRGAVNNNGLKSLRDDYVDFYRNQYNYLQSAGDIKYKEFPRNSSRTIELYQLEEFWSEYDDGSYKFELLADETRRYLHAPKAPRYRTRPYLLGSPNIIKEISILNFSHDIKNEIAQETVSNDYFTYTVTVKQDAATRRLLIAHKYESHALSVPPEAIVKYTKDIDRAYEISSILIPNTGLDWGGDASDSDPESDPQHDQEPSSEEENNTIASSDGSL